MHKTPDDIFNLMMEKLSGYISREEDVWLEGLIATDKDVRQKWEVISKRIEDMDLGEYLKTTGRTVQLPPSEPSGGTVRSVRRFWLPIAAIWTLAILLLGTLAWLLLFRWSGHPFSRQVAGSNQLNEKAITLKLADGRSITLPSQSDSTYSLGRLQLKTSNKTLSFSENTMGLSGENTLTVPIGMDYKVKLSDGSLVYLNSATVLSFPSRFSGPLREISINGEAFLQVAKDSFHPFIVNLPQGTVKVLGTEFNVNSYENGVLKVALVRGAVDMKAGNRSLALKPGQEGVYQAGKLHTQAFDEQSTLGWRQGIYYFDNATLSQIVEVLPRWFGMQVDLENPEKAEERFTGRVYRNAPITDFLNNLKTTMAIKYYIKDSVVHFQ